MNLYESIKRNIKESEEFYAKCIKNGNDVNTEYFDSQSEAEEFAEKVVKNNDYDEVDVYKASNDDCIGIYDKSEFNESDSKEERIKWLEDALVSVYSYGIRSCVIDNIVPGLTNKDSYASLSDEYKKLTGKDFNIKEHIKNESELKDSDSRGNTYYIGPHEYVTVKSQDDNSDVVEFYLDDNKYSDEVIPKDWDERKIRTFAGLVSRHEGPRGNRDFVKEVNDKFKESDESERVDLFLRNDYGDWVDYLWYYPSTGKFFAPFEKVSHAEAWKRLNDPQVKQAVSDSWGENTEKVYNEMLDYLKSCDDLNESELKESYDTINVIEEVQSDLENLISNLEGQISNDIGKDVVIQALKSILTKLEKNSEEAG